jgi:hypothetical protein
MSADSAPKNSSNLTPELIGAVLRALQAEVLANTLHSHAFDADHLAVVGSNGGQPFYLGMTAAAAVRSGVGAWSVIDLCTNHIARLRREREASTDDELGTAMIDAIASLRGAESDGPQHDRASRVARSLWCSCGGQGPTWVVAASYAMQAALALTKPERDYWTSDIDDECRALTAQEHAAAVVQQLVRLIAMLEFGAVGAPGSAFAADVLELAGQKAAAQRDAKPANGTTTTTNVQA